MISPFRRTSASVAVIFSLLLCNLSANADQQNCQDQGNGGTLSESTYAVVERAVDDLSNDRLDDAETRLKDVLARAKGYERAVILQTLGYVYAQQDTLPQALEVFREALDMAVLPRQPQEDLLLNTGQLYLADGQLSEGVSLLEKYLKEACKTPPAEAHIALASAYTEQKRYADALTQVSQGIAKAKSANESWLQLKLALHFELDQLRECADTLVQLLSMSPQKQDYWRQLAGVMLQLERDQQALAVLAIAERQGFVADEAALKNLANLYLMLNIPFKAGGLLSRGIEDQIIENTADNFEYLSEAWIAAREWRRAENALTRAASLSKNGDLWQRVAQVQMEKEDWSQAQKSLQAALRAGVTNKGKASYLLGIAAYHNGDKNTALEALRQAADDPAIAQQAKQWLDHVQQSANPVI